MANRYPYPKRIEQVDGGFIVSDADNARVNPRVHTDLESALADLRERFVRGLE